MGEVKIKLSSLKNCLVSLLLKFYIDNFWKTISQEIFYAQFIKNQK